MSEETGYLYTLSDPRTGEIRYVGATVNPEARLYTHTQAPHSHALSEWNADLAADGEEPQMDLRSKHSVDVLFDEEERLIKELASEYDLLNRKSNPECSRPFGPRDRSDDTTSGDGRRRLTQRIPADLARDIETIQKKYGLGTRNGTINFLLNHAAENLLEDEDR